MGIPSIDGYHAELFAHVDRLRIAMRARNGIEAAQLLALLEEYALDHFAGEERHMEEAGYRGLAEHRGAHREFVRELGAHRARLGPASPTPRLIVELSFWLAAWLVDHIRVQDAAMARHLEERSRPREAGR